MYADTQTRTRTTHTTHTHDPAQHTYIIISCTMKVRSNTCAHVLAVPCLPGLACHCFTCSRSPWALVAGKTADRATNEVPPPDVCAPAPHLEVLLVHFVSPDTGDMQPGPVWLPQSRSWGSHLHFRGRLGCRWCRRRWRPTTRAWRGTAAAAMAVLSPDFHLNFTAGFHLCCPSPGHGAPGRSPGSSSSRPQARRGGSTPPCPDDEGAQWSALHHDQITNCPSLARESPAKPASGKSTEDPPPSPAPRPNCQRRQIPLFSAARTGRLAPRRAGRWMAAALKPASLAPHDESGTAKSRWRTRARCSRGL